MQLENSECLLSGFRRCESDGQGQGEVESSYVGPQSPYDSKLGF